MQRYFFKRFIRAVIVVWLVATTFFFALRMISDPVELLFSQSGMATPQEKQAMREFLKLDSPIHIQYADFLFSAAQGDMGHSFRFRQPALPMLLGRIPATLELTFAALAIAAVIGSILGIVAALKPHTLVDHFTIFLSLLGQSVPVFWLGIVLMLIFAVQLGWLPATGRGDLSHLILPAFCLSTYPTASVARLLRSSMMDVMSQDYIRTARAKGLPETVVVIRHGLRNAAIPAITMLGLLLSRLLGGAVVVETIFDWPGIGSLAYKAISLRDFTMVQAASVVFGVAVVVTNFVVDMIYAWIDPRIRYA